MESLTGGGFGRPAMESLTGPHFVGPALGHSDLLADARAAAGRRSRTPSLSGSASSSGASASGSDSEQGSCHCSVNRRLAQENRALKARILELERRCEDVETLETALANSKVQLVEIASGWSAMKRQLRLNRKYAANLENQLITSKQHRFALEESLKDIAQGEAQFSLQTLGVGLAAAV